MAKQNDQRTKTLSISITPELADVLSAHVESGLYKSASEVIREALRLLFKVERAQQASAGTGDGPLSLAAARFESLLELSRMGQAIQVEKLRRAEPGLSEEQLQARLSALGDSMEAGEGLRIAPERLEKFKLRGQD